MQFDELANIKNWFETYTQSFLTGCTADDGPLVLKIDHTARVSENMRLLGQAAHLSEDQCHAAEAIGWFHDAGRFKQYRQYRTFNDRRSVNHAALAVKIIDDASLLASCASDERQAIRDAVRFHNAPALPKNRPEASTVYMKLIRDADKLDIWKVFADFCRNGDQPEAAIVQHLSDQPTWTDAIVNAIMEGKMARFEDMQSICDFKLLQLSWVFDLNWPESLRQARLRGDVGEIARSLPHHRTIDDVVDRVMGHLIQ
ncbi:MAG: HD family phosphohydrolase [Proteobacteria bacterium]|nr:MAG: HD family phosphohydrolase [Pseudomonadota bacterium]PIE68128.1 MAG: HD family phosphohydrolase [Deltaproteobacteria bacterium]